MHYKNGREAKVGDPIVTRDFNGIPQAGVVVKTVAGSTTCNLIVAPVTNVQWLTASDCVHADDAMEVAVPTPDTPAEAVSE